MSKELYELKSFEDIKHIDEYGEEYWCAREEDILAFFMLFFSIFLWYNYQKQTKNGGN